MKHIGLAVMGVDGRLIRQLKTYILRCYACFRTTSIMDKVQVVCCMLTEQNTGNPYIFPYKRGVLTLAITEYLFTSHVSSVKWYYI